MDADVETRVEELVIAARFSFVDIKNPEWSSWAHELLVNNTPSVDLDEELAALEAKYNESVQELDDLFFVGDGSLSANEYAAKTEELKTQWENDKEEVERRASASVKGKGKEKERARSVTRSESPVASGANDKVGESVEGDDGESASAIDEYERGSTIDIDESKQLVPFVEKTLVEREDTPVAQSSVVANSFDWRKQGPCDRCRKKSIECVRDEGLYNCQLCVEKKQACHWDGINRHGVKPKPRQRKAKNAKSASEVPEATSSPAASVKRKRSVRLIVPDSDGGAEEEKGSAQVEEDEEAQVDDTVRPSKSKCSSL